jgi:hypothetical protein
MASRSCSTLVSTGAGGKWFTTCLETEWGFYRPVVVRVPPNHVAHHGGEHEEGGRIHAGLTVLHGIGKSPAVNF